MRARKARAKPDTPLLVAYLFGSDASAGLRVPASFSDAFAVAQAGWV